MKTAQRQLCLAGSPDFIARLSGTAREPFYQSTNFELVHGNISETRQLVLSTRPHVLIIEVGLRLTSDDFLWLHALLKDLRERFKRTMYIIAAVTAPQKMLYAGNLLFADNTSTSPSGLIDDFLIAPPGGAPIELSLERQFQNSISFFAELMESGAWSENLLPALWEDAWIPSMCDPQSREIWMRWVPRYAAYVNENPLIVGPTGSGKTRLAAALHRLSGRPGPFVSITPRDFSSTELVQAELFGAVPGAYTGAVEKWGLVKKADKGTLFIDELQSIDLDLQGKLITFIENKTYRRVGEAECQQADVRFVFACNRPLADLVAQGKLRDDFAYRLERLQLALKPLEERRLDISAGICFALARVLRERAAGSSKTVSSLSWQLEGLTPEAHRRLFFAAWPGNLRQLENNVAKLIEISSINGKLLIDEEAVEEGRRGLLGDREVKSDDLFAEAAKKAAESLRLQPQKTLREFLAATEAFARRAALERMAGSIQEAARLLGDSEKALIHFKEHQS